MNKRKIIVYIVALLLSLMFICVVAFSQKPTKDNGSNKKELPGISSVDEKDNDEPIVTIHQEEVQEDILDFENSYQEYSVPSNRGFKSYMSYKAITSKSSPQYKLQSQYAYTGEYGIRQVDGRFCVAIGTFSNTSVGTYIDLILENGTVIPCIVSDFKADIHTDSSNIVTVHNGCVSEFLVDNGNLYSTAKQMGDVSYCKEEWKSPVVVVRVYERNVFNGE